MPFTLTHVIAIVPLKKAPVLSRLSFAALAIGSMIPDAPIFFPFVSEYSVTHTAAGIFTACLPLGLLFYALFQLVIRIPLLEIMPPTISSKLGQATRHTPAYLAGVVVAICLGAATHVFWDSFTHIGGWGARRVPVLAQIHEIFGYPIAGSRLLQHVSSVVCLPIMAFMLYRWAGRRRASAYREKLRLSPLLKLTLFTLMFAAPAIYALVEAWLHGQSVFRGIGYAARNYGTYLAITMIAGSMAISTGILMNRHKAHV